MVTNVPQRLVIEDLINLLRSNWIEVRSHDDQTYFAATPAGRKRAGETALPEMLQKDVRWDAVCVERIAGHWMRADDLDLVHERDLPSDAEQVSPLTQTFDPNHAALRDLFRLNSNESSEPTPPQFRPPSAQYARVGIAFGDVQTGLPFGVPMALRQSLLDASVALVEGDTPS